MNSSKYVFDAFISYSHAADGQLAPSLQTGLEKVARPWYRLRSFRLFRDQTNLSANPSLWTAIEAALAQAHWFILLASPEAASSKWVAQEIRWWLGHRSTESLLIVVTDGEVVWDDTSGGFDPNASTAIPAALHRAYGAEPLYIDLRWARKPADLAQSSVRFRSALLDLAAPLRGVSKDVLDGEAVRTLRQNRCWAGAAMLALACATTWAFLSRDAAIKSAVRTSVELDARRVIAIAGTKNQADALPLAVLAASDSLERLKERPGSVLSALRYGIEGSRETRRWQTGGQITAATFTPDGKHLITISRSNTVQRWTLDGEPREFQFSGAKPPDFNDDQFSISLTASRTAILTQTGAKTVRVWSLDGTDLLAGRTVGTQFVAVASAAARVYAVDPRGRVEVHARGHVPPRILPYRVRRPLKALHASKDGGLLAFIYMDGGVDVLRQGRAALSLPKACREGSGMTGDTKRLVSVGCGHVRIADLNKGSEVVRDHKALALVREVAVHPSGAFSVTHERDDRIDWFNERGTPAAESMLGSENPHIAISPDGAWLAAGGYLDGAVRLFDLTNRSARVLTTGGTGIAVSTLDVCVDRPQVYWATQQGEIATVDYAKLGNPPTVLAATNEYIENVRCFPGGGVVSSDRGGTIAYWNGTAVSYLRRDPNIGFDAIAVVRSKRIVLMPTSRTIERWEVGREIRRLPPLKIPPVSSSWFRVVVGSNDRDIVIGSDTGQLAIYDAASGAVKRSPRKTLWSNAWTVSPDLADRGFVLAGAGTEVAVFDWSGGLQASFRTDQFLFAADAALDSARDMIALPTMAGEVLIRDLKGNPVGPTIRNVGDNQLVYVRFSPDRYLFTGGLTVGVTMHDLDLHRLFRMGCRLLAQRMIRDDAEYAELNERAASRCSSGSLP